MMEIISLNTRGIADNVKRQQVFYWLHRQKANIILLQETHSSFDRELVWRAQWGATLLCAHGSTNARGVAILIKNKVNFEIHEIISHEHGRYIILDITLEDKRITLVNVYGPNEDNEEFFLDLIDKIDSLSNDHCIIGGDFNLVLNPSLDMSEGRENLHPKATDLLLTYMEDTDLIDVWRRLNPGRKTFTWYRRNPTYIASRLDFFLCSFGMSNMITMAKIKPGFKSDHSIVSIELLLLENKRGPGYFKLNCSLLHDAQFIVEIKNVIQETIIDNNNLSPDMVWEMIKLNVRGKTIEYASIKKKTQDNRLTYLENKLEELNKNEPENVESIETCRIELEDLIHRKSMGAKIRSRVKWFEEGEKTTKYFCSLEKRNFNLKTINRIQKSQGEDVTSQKKILEELQEFYSKLYSKDQRIIDDNIMQDFLSREGPRLSEEDMLEGSGEFKLKENEITSAIQIMQNNKSPRIDGLPVKFYKVFWLDLKESFMKAIAPGWPLGF